MADNLVFTAEKTSSDPLDRACLVVGHAKHVQSVTFDNFAEKLKPRVNAETFNTVCSTLSPSQTCHVWLDQVAVCSLPSGASRHNSRFQPHALTRIVNSCLPAGNVCIVVVCEKAAVFSLGCAIARAFPLFSVKSKFRNARSRTVTVEFHVVGNGAPVVEDDVVCEKAAVFSLGCAIARAFPLFSLKSKFRNARSRTVTVEFHVVGDGGPVVEDDVNCLTAAAEGIRLAAKIVDTPCNDMHTDVFLKEVCQVGKELGITPTIIQGEELYEKGFGGIYGVGKAAVHLPALAVLSHIVPSASRTIAWVGKGIVYDTGGLSIKSKTAMPGMKRDCGGAAAILGGFRAAVKQGFKENLHAVLCLAENAVGPLSARPDDIHILYSGKSVEINNTDAEGRLVLGDGVAYARKDLKADVVLDMATLTGAQGVSTGKYHGALLTNKEDWERASLEAGRSSGDLVFPIPYCPEFHFTEFASAVADMKNSVQNRDNAQSSCAGLFIGAHLGFDYPGSWLHIDMAAPVHHGERATGYGVALLLTLFGKASNSPLLQSIAPNMPPSNQ